MSGVFNFIFSTAYAQSAGAAGAPSTVEVLLMPMGFLVIMYFFMIRPQHRKAKEQMELVKNLKVGDEIVTTGGIIGKIKSVADAFVTVESSNSAVKVLKSHVTSLMKNEASATPIKK